MRRQHTREKMYHNGGRAPLAFPSAQSFAWLTLLVNYFSFCTRPLKETDPWLFKSKLKQSRCNHNFFNQLLLYVYLKDKPISLRRFSEFCLFSPKPGFHSFKSSQIGHLMSNLTHPQSSLSSHYYLLVKEPILVFHAKY